jgi:hypothetical protein
VEPEGKRPLGRPRFRWDDNIKIEFGGMDWNELIQMGFFKTQITSLSFNCLE